MGVIQDACDTLAACVICFRISHDDVALAGEGLSEPVRSEVSTPPRQRRTSGRGPASLITHTRSHPMGEHLDAQHRQPRERDQTPKPIQYAVPPLREIEALALDG